MTEHKTELEELRQENLQLQVTIQTLSTMLNGAESRGIQLHLDAIEKLKNALEEVTHRYNQLLADPALSGRRIAVGILRDMFYRLDREIDDLK